jgi:Arc/MetJ-type ribon-helix-helix transcriptional regulator
MADILIHLDGEVEKTLKRLVETGFFKTKAEAVRAGILEMGRDYYVVKSKEELMDELALQKMQRMEEEIKTGKRRVYSESEVKKRFKL